MEPSAIRKSGDRRRHGKLRRNQRIVGCSATDSVRAQICLLEKSRSVIEQSDKKGWATTDLKCIAHIAIFLFFYGGFMRRRLLLFGLLLSGSTSLPATDYTLLATPTTVEW